jgi:hypothetical protein
MKRVLVYDCEIANPILDKSQTEDPAYTYARGWGDYVGMGISVIAAYHWGHGYRIFLADNMAEFADLASDPETFLVGYGNKGFDDPLIQTVLNLRLAEGQSFDLLAAVAAHEGKRQSLHNLCVANFLAGKTVVGHEAPFMWQQGKIGAVVDYGLSDVIKTKKLIESALEGNLRSPSTGRKMELDITALQDMFAWLP